jgi:hypothetical protein
MTPKEMGRRFLALIDSLKIIDELTLQRVTEQTKLPLRYAAGARSHAFVIRAADSQWHYGLSYFEDAASKIKTARYEFSNPVNEQADMTPVCGESFQDYARLLKEMGFTMTVQNDEIGRVIDYSFYRPQIQVIVTERRERLAEDAGPSRSCVKSMAIHSVD